MGSTRTIHWDTNGLLYLPLLRDLNWTPWFRGTEIIRVDPKANRRNPFEGTHSKRSFADVFHKKNEVCGLQRKSWSLSLWLGPHNLDCFVH